MKLEERTEKKRGREKEREGEREREREIERERERERVATTSMSPRQTVDGPSVKLGDSRKELREGELRDGCWSFRKRTERGRVTRRLLVLPEKN